MRYRMSSPKRWQRYSKPRTSAWRNRRRSCYWRISNSTFASGLHRSAIARSNIRSKDNPWGWVQCRFRVSDFASLRCDHFGKAWSDACASWSVRVERHHPSRGHEPMRIDFGCSFQACSRSAVYCWQASGPACQWKGWLASPWVQLICHCSLSYFSFLNIQL